MLSREGKQTDRGAVGAEFIGYNRRRREALLLQEFPHQPNCRPSVPAGLNQEIQDFALTVNGTPEIELPPSNYDDHLVQVPAFGRSWPPTLNPPRIGPTEFQDPSSNCLIRDVETTLGKQVLNVPIAQRETAIEPDGMLDDDRWKAVTTVGYLAHPETLKHRPCRSHAVNVTMPSNLFVTLFLDAHQTPPARITLDIDATDVETHGRQENAFFHGYYEHRCFLPLYVFCGRHLLLAQLRPANIDGARGARNQIRRIVAMIRERWPNVGILLRGDSGFARENLMRWCEGNAVDYVFGLARNDVLLKKALRVRGKAAIAMIETGQPVRAYGDFHHITKSRTWARPRRVIAKVEHKPGHEQRCRFLVTSLNRHQVPPRELYEDTYCPRGDMENRIKDCQLDLFANRMSAHAYKANQLRLLLAAFAYVLIDGIRRAALKKTTLAKAVPNTIRLKLLKVGAKVINSVRRIKLSLPDSCPYRDLFFKAHAALAPP